MEDSVIKLDLKQVEVDILRTRCECKQRKLKHTEKWLTELHLSLSEPCAEEPTSDTSEMSKKELQSYRWAETLFQFEEYDRAAWFTRNCQSNKARFLHLYARYLSYEKKKLDNAADLPPDPLYNEDLKSLCSELRIDNSQGRLDGYGLYLFGVVLKKLQLFAEAMEILLESVHKIPMHWGSWLELATLVTDKERFENLLLPNHWMKYFFMAHMYLELQLLDEALALYNELQNIGFDKNRYIMAQIAITVHHKRDLDTGIEIFRRTAQEDPYCLDNMDVYSNLLYVKDSKVDLADLAHKATKIDKFRLETCCIVGNYYSMRSDHHKAVLYFQRALRLNPLYTSAWTLLGHEFMEMKNTNGAIHSYRQAIDVNKRDYRAWYGLGQTYEILKMPFYAIYYYKKAHLLRPHDSRMLFALGESYEKQDKIKDAMKCYYKASNVGDIEGMALLRLAMLYEKVNENDQAAAAYTDFVNDEFRHVDKSDLSRAFRYLANHHLKRDQLESANLFAQKCLLFEDTKEEAKGFLRTIAQKRTKVDDNPMVVEDMNETDPVSSHADPSSSGAAATEIPMSPINLTYMPTQ